MDTEIIAEHLQFPEGATSSPFGRVDRRDAYVTLSGTGRLAKVRWPRPGLALNFLDYR